MPAGVPLGIRLGPRLFLVMIKTDLKLPYDELLHIWAELLEAWFALTSVKYHDNLLILMPFNQWLALTMLRTTGPWKFADDTTVSEILPPSGSSSLQLVVDHISDWSDENHLQLNASKCKEISTCFKRSPPSYPSVSIDGLEFKQVSAAKVLGVPFRPDLKWNDHISNITSTVKAAKRLYLLRQLKRAEVIARDPGSFYCSAIRLIVEYACALFHCSLPEYLSNELERIQKRDVCILSSRAQVP